MYLYTHTHALSYTTYDLHTTDVCEGIAVGWREGKVGGGERGKERKKSERLIGFLLFPESFFSLFFLPVLPSTRSFYYCLFSRRFNGREKLAHARVYLYKKYPRVYYDIRYTPPFRPDSEITGVVIRDREFLPSRRIVDH